MERYGKSKLYRSASLKAWEPLTNSFEIGESLIIDIRVLLIIITFYGRLPESASLSRVNSNFFVQLIVLYFLLNITIFAEWLTCATLRIILS